MTTNRRTNFLFGDEQLHPFMPLPLNHVVECPTNWLADPNLKPVDVVVLLVMMAHATPTLEVQISRKQICRITKARYKAIHSSMKRLVKFGYVEKIPYENGFIPIFKVHPKIEQTKKQKSKKSKFSGDGPPRKKAGGGAIPHRGSGPGGPAPKQR